MKNKAFTLVEVLIAITLTTVVITAVCGLILSTMLSNQRNIHELQGMYFAEESLEAVRFMRDSNWLQNYSWDGGQKFWGADFVVGESFYLKKDCSLDPTCFSFSNNELDGTVTSADGFSFVRSLKFEKVSTDVEAEAGVFDGDAVQVTATVYWVDRGVPREVSLSTYLSNWK